MEEGKGERRRRGERKEGDASFLTSSDLHLMCALPQGTDTLS